MKIRAAHYRTKQIKEFTFEKGRLISVVPSKIKTTLLFGPGLFDIQCNGFAGIDFNHPSFNPKGFQIAIHAMWRYGTTHIMPTIMTESFEYMAARMRTICAALKEFPEICPCVPAIHQEGPYLANMEGARGAHPFAHIISPNLEHFDSLQKAASGMIRMVTLAPEVNSALKFIRVLAKRGIVIAIGHTNATSNEIIAGVEAGAKASTHLGNGSAQVLPRHNNYILAQLGEDRLYASFIPDGHHLPPFVLQSFLRAKPFQKNILITDSMAAAGAPPGRYTLGRILVEVGRDRVVCQPGKPNFAGSGITLNEGVANAVRLGKRSLAEAWDMASLHPWNLMQHSIIARQPKINHTFIIVHHHQNHFSIKATVINRQLVYFQGK